MTNLSNYSKKGTVLMVVLWLITTLSIFGIGLSRTSYSGYRFALRHEHSFLGAHAVNSILLLVKFDRVDDETPSYDTLSELAYEDEYECGPLDIVYSVIDEERKININKASSMIMMNLPSMDEDKAVAIANSELKPFVRREELLMVEEMDSETYNEIKDMITVYGNGQVNINTCQEEILEVLGVGEELISRIMTFRKGEDGELYTEDDGEIETFSNIASRLKEEVSLSADDELTLASLVSRGLLGVKSDNYRIEADAYANNKLVSKYSAVLSKKKNSDDYYIKEWEE